MRRTRYEHSSRALIPSARDRRHRGDPAAQATPLLRANDRGVLYGDGVFETLHVRPGGPWLLDAHLDRLARSAALLELTCPRGRADLAAAGAQAPSPAARGRPAAGLHAAARACLRHGRRRTGRPCVRQRRDGIQADHRRPGRHRDRPPWSPGGRPRRCPTPRTWPPGAGRPRRAPTTSSGSQPTGTPWKPPPRTWSGWPATRSARSRPRTPASCPAPPRRTCWPGGRAGPPRRGTHDHRRRAGRAPTGSG